MNFSIRSDAVTLDSSEVPLWVADTILGQYFQVAITTVLVYQAGGF